MVGTMVTAVAAPSAPPHHTTLQHSNNATLITRSIITTAETMQIVGCCDFFIFTWLCLLSYVYSLMFAHLCLLNVLPLLTQTHAFPHPKDTLRGHKLSHLDKKIKERSNVSFLLLVVVQQCRCMGLNDNIVNFLCKFVIFWVASCILIHGKNVCDNSWMVLYLKWTSVNLATNHRLQILI